MHKYLTHALLYRLYPDEHMENITKKQFDLLLSYLGLGRGLSGL